MRTRIVRYLKITYMGWFEKNGASVIGAGASFITDMTNTFAQMHQNEANRKYQQAENEKNRAWQASQNQINRDWQEQMYKKYESPQSQVNQLKAAGINPYFDGVSPNSVGSASTGSASTGSLPPGAPLNPGNAIQDAVMTFLNIKRMQSDIEATEESTRSQYLDNVRKEFENGNLQEVYNYQIALIEAGLKSKNISNAEAEVRKKAVELAYNQAKEASDKGINPVVDQHNAITATTAYTKAQTLSENLLRMPRKSQIEADTALKRLSYELDDKYGRDLMSTNVTIQEEALKKMQYEFNEFVDNREFRDRLIKAGASESEANAIIAGAKSTVDSIDANYLKTLAGDGNDWYSPVGTLFYALWSKNGVAGL